MNTLKEEEVLDKSLNYLDGLNNKDNIETWVIRYNGKILTLPSGKSSWKKKNHATSAFTNSLYGMFSSYRNGWEPSDVTKFLIEKEVIKIERLL